MNDFKLVAFAAVAGLALIYVATRKGVAESVAGAAVGAAAGAAKGTVEAVGEAIGVPKTNTDKCKAALAAGDYWEASFQCPAGTFISGTAKGVWNSTTAYFSGKADADLADQNYSHEGRNYARQTTPTDYSNGDPLTSSDGVNYNYF